MKRFGVIVAFGLVMGTTLLMLRMISNQGSAQELEISEEDYANGPKRFAAVAKKVTPGLKAKFAEKELEWESPVFLRAFKEERILELWVKKKDTFVLFESYHIAGASGDPGPKLREGDQQVPEGFYYVTPNQMNPRSNFHLSFNIGYPNKFDKAHGRDGTFIMIHGSDVSIGCLAMTDPKIEEIYTLCQSAFDGGQKFFRVHIFPFRMTSEKMAEHQESRWYSFWENLREGFQWFEEKKIPPNTLVKDRRYHFE